VREFVNEVLDAAGPAQKTVLRPLTSAADRFDTAANAMGRRVEALLAADSPERRKTAIVDDALIKTERTFLDAAGLPGRPWYRHLLFAPLPTYEPEVLPGITEALASGDRSRLDEQVAHLARALDRAASVLSGAGSDLDLLVRR
jgi:N-acetylated-alpha-linked acidic dipeptidase